MQNANIKYLTRVSPHHSTGSRENEKVGNPPDQAVRFYFRLISSLSQASAIPHDLFNVLSHERQYSG